MTYEDQEFSVERIKSHFVEYYAIGNPWILLGHVKYI
jgi:hypothetical protein